LVNTKTNPLTGRRSSPIKPRTMAVSSTAGQNPMPLNAETLPSAAPLPGLPEWTGFCEAAHQSNRYALDLHCLKAAGLQVDLSGQRHSPELQAAGAALLAARHFNTARKQLLNGGIVNGTEQRAAWHSALRRSE